MKKEDRNNRIKLIMEKYYPLFFSSIFTVFCIIQSSTFTLRDDIMAAVNAGTCCSVNFDWFCWCISWTDFYTI